MPISSARPLNVLMFALFRGMIMCISWLFALFWYGLFAGFRHIPDVAWLLLVPFFVQDSYDTRRRRR